MNMIIEPMSRRAAIEYSKDRDILRTAIISITEPRAETVRFDSNPRIVAILHLKFFDSIMESSDSIQEWQANEIVDFVSNVKDQVEEILIQCEAGQSRSAGVAAALMLWLNGTNDEIMKDNYYYPNKRCFELVMGSIEKKIKEISQ